MRLNYVPILHYKLILSNISKKNFEIFIEFITSIRNLRSELNIPYKQLINIFIEAKNEEKAQDNITKEHEVDNNWEYRDLIEIEKLWYTIF